MLTSYEKQQLTYFIVQTRIEQRRILDAAILDPKTSGPLIVAYRWAIVNT